MTTLVLGLCLALPAQAPEPPAARPDLAARRQEELKATIARRKARAEAQAEARCRARAEAQSLHRAELEYRAKVAPFVAEQQYRSAQLAARERSDQAWLRIARHNALSFAYGVGAPVTVGPEGYQVYDGFADYGYGRP
jgi:hypothetical protein